MGKLYYKEGDIVLCTVKNIVGTTVFLKIEDDGEGTMITSEVAAGRIRNLRDYVVPNKKIVCKILKIDNSGNVYLSLRRVTGKETKEILERYKKEKSILGILKTVLGDEAEKIWEKIKKEEASIIEFFQEAKEKSGHLEKYVPKIHAEKIFKILKDKKEKEVQVKKYFKFSSNDENGIEKIKNVLLPYKENITYISAGNYLASIKAENYKIANQKIKTILEDVEQQAKKHKMHFEVKEK